MKTVLEMAREAEIHVYPEFEKAFERFANLIRADERDACAKVCEGNVWIKDVAWWQEVTKSEVSVESSIQCAAAIRARGNT